MSRLNVRRLDGTSVNVGWHPTVQADGSVAWAECSCDSGASAPTTVLVPWTAVVGGSPENVYDQDDNLVLSEDPL